MEFQYFSAPQGKSDAAWAEATAKAIVREHLAWSGSTGECTAERGRNAIAEAMSAYAEDHRDEYEDFAELHEGATPAAWRSVIEVQFENIAADAVRQAGKKWAAAMTLLGIEEA